VGQASSGPEGSRDGKIAGNRDVAVIDRFTAGCFEAREQMNIAISRSVVFIARVQRAGPEGDSQDMIARTHVNALTSSLLGRQ
jgi:hypothetical protein